MAAGVRLIISRLALLFILPLDFHGRVRVVRSMYLPAALHGIEASLLASDSLRKLRSAVRRVVWSRRQPLASVGAVLGLLDGPLGGTLLFAWYGLGFVYFDAILLFGPLKSVGFVACLLWFMRVVLGMVLFIFFLLALLRLGLSGTLMTWLGFVLVYLCLAIWLALFSTCRLLFLMPGVTRLLLTFLVVKVFVVVLCLMFMALCSSLILLVFGKEIRLCFGASWLVVFGMVCFLEGCGVMLFLVGFVVLLMMMVIFFWDCPFPPLVEVRENPEFHDLMRLDKAHWPRCLLWHGWLPVLSGVNGASPWALDASESAAYLVEVALGRYSSGLIAD